jgi:hypothetical protein
MSSKHHVFLRIRPQAHVPSMELAPVHPLPLSAKTVTLASSSSCSLSLSSLCVEEEIFVLPWLPQSLKKIFLTVHYFNSFVPIDQQAGQAGVLGRLSLSMCV